MSENILPENWTLAKLGDIAEIVGGGTPDRNNTSYFGGDIPWVSPTDIAKLDDIWIDTTAESITESGLKHSSAVLLPGGTVLMTCRASFGLVAINRREMCTSQSLYSFVCNEEIVFNEYLARYLVFIRDRLALLSGETTFKGISKSTLSTVEIILPPLPEQRRIAAILREADEIRKLRRQANEKAQEIVSALFYDMFGDPATNPKIWKMEKIGDLITFATSGPRNWAMHYTPQGAKFIRVQNLTNHKLNFDNMVFITPPNNVEAKRSKVEPNDVLFSITGVVGLVAVVPEDIDNAYVSQHVAIVRLKPDVDPHFIVAFLAHKAGGQAQISLQQYGQTKPGFGLSDIHSINVFVPPYSLQKQFTEKLADINMLGSKLDKSYSGLDILYQSLLTRAFTGDLTATWREQHSEELAQVASERDHLLAQLRLAPAELVTPAQPTRSEISERQELLALLNDVERALLALLDEQPAAYYTANSAREELTAFECSLDVVRRELHFLAAAGWIKEQTLPAEGETGSVSYIPVYRSLLPDDHSWQPDIDRLIARLGPEYPDEVLV